MDPFLRDVHAGLSSEPKRLPSKYFYDEIGDALFVKIMGMPEYYLTRAEMAIFTEQAADIVAGFEQSKTERFEVIELGAGDGSKTRHLLTELLQQGYVFDYVPIDISANALEGLERSMKAQLPELSIKPKAGDYFQMLAELRLTKVPKVVLFLGSNIGNLLDEEATHFMAGLEQNLRSGDKLLLGVDLIKPQSKVLPAYDDAQGYTRDFNLNLLTRINSELGGDFDLSQFEHQAEYTMEEGIARSFLLSRKAQTVTLGANQQRYQFAKGEKMKVEISRKYDRTIIEQIIRASKFRISAVFKDQEYLFADFLLEVGR